MKERVTIRLYEDPRRCARCENLHYRPTEDVKGWDYGCGDQIGLNERQGGYLMGVIERVHPDVHKDDTGQFKLAELWTQD